MAAPVPYKRTQTRIGDILVGEPVRAQTWRELGMLLHWLRGHGSHIIPAHYPGLVINATSTPETLNFRIEPQGLSIERVWVIQTRQGEWTGAGVPAFLKITLPGGSTVTIGPPDRTGATFREIAIVLFETIAKSDSIANIALTFERVSGDVDVTIESVCAFDLPRAVLTLDGTDLGVDFETLRPGAAIFDSTNLSLGAVVENLADRKTAPRRHLWMQSTSPLESDPGGAGNPTAWVDLFALDIPILPRKVSTTDTTFVCDWNLYWHVSAGGTNFQARITTGNGPNIDVIQIAGVTSPTWGSDGAIELDAEDPGEDDGVPGGGLETVQIAVRRTAGTGKVTVYTTEVWETAPP